MVTTNPDVASLLKSNLPANAPPAAPKKKILKNVGLVVASITFILILAWMGGYIPGTNRNTVHRGGYNKPGVRAAGLKVKWNDPGEMEGDKRTFSVAVRDSTTPDEKLIIKAIYTDKAPEERDATSRWVISSHYGTSNPDPDKVKMFTSIIVDGVDIDVEGGELNEEVKSDMDVVEKAAALTDFEVGSTTKRLYNPETGMCLARDDGNSDTNGFKSELVECGGATGFDIVGETLVAGVEGESMCFPFDKSKRANAKISAATSTDAKEVFVATHPCNMGLYEVKKDTDGNFVGVGQKCFMTDASGKNLEVSASNCFHKDKRARFELKDKSEIVSGAGVQDPPGA